MRWFKIIIILLITLTFKNQTVYSAGGGNIYIPLISNNPTSTSSIRTINIPYFNVSDLATKTPEMAILWFGKVNLNDNYTDVRIGYNNSELLIYAQVFDRRLWYNPSPSTSSFEDWDSLAVTLHLSGGSSTLTQQSYQFLSQLYWWEGSANFKKSFQGNNNTWVEKPLSSTTSTGWRGNAPNDNVDDRGWTATFHIPFSTLGLSTTPANGTIWRLGFNLYDRDSANGPSLSPKVWPEDFQNKNPNSWGQLRFGMPGYISPKITSQQTSILRQGVSGMQVPDSPVGGGSVCGSGLDFWTQWGNANYSGVTFFNVQNQTDVADWPCFSKHYVTFPLTNIPAGKLIKSAHLSLHQFGNADPQNAKSSLIQVFSIKDDWNESTLTWNNAPLALENLSQTWVGVIQTSVPWPGNEYTWDVSRAVDQAYQSGTPVRLVIYSADSAQHSGKYFTTSEAGDWDAVGRPTLFVDWGNPN